MSGLCWRVGDLEPVDAVELHALRSAKLARGSRRRRQHQLKTNPALAAWFQTLTAAERTRFLEGGAHDR